MVGVLFALQVPFFFLFSSRGQKIKVHSAAASGEVITFRKILLTNCQRVFESTKDSEVDALKEKHLANAESMPVSHAAYSVLSEKDCTVLLGFAAGLVWPRASC